MQAAKHLIDALMCDYPASVQSRANVGPPAKRHLMAFRWWTDSGPLLYAK